ncbi:hypothetical protein V1514DRAFT_339012 [Lipomyces japonicus]|uniref:uncharacterized protein n=1 Tax=Lipomyces japonicus TaxID=56871 RepID=UPI0034CDF6DE
MSTSSSSKKRANLVVPYAPVEPKKKEDVSALLSTTLPMVALFLKNKLVGWSALLVAIQSWLNETEDSQPAQPGWIKIILSISGLLVCYMDVLLPKSNFATVLSGGGAPSSGAVTTRLSFAPKPTAV